MVEALRANIDRESPFLKGVGGAIYPTISGIEDDVSHPVNAFQRCLWKFSHKESSQVADFLREKYGFIWKSLVRFLRALFGA